MSTFLSVPAVIDVTVSALVSNTARLAPVSITPEKLLPVLVSVTLPAPASTVVTPLAADIAVPTDWVMSPFPAAVLSVNAPVAVTLLASVKAPLACNVMLAPLRSPGVVNGAPLASRRFAAPVLMPSPGRIKAPAA